MTNETYKEDSPNVQEFDGIPYVSLGPFEVVASSSPYVVAEPVYYRQPSYKWGKIWPSFEAEGTSAEHAVSKCVEKVKANLGKSFNNTRQAILDLLINALLCHYTLVGSGMDRKFTCSITTRF